MKEIDYSIGDPLRVLYRKRRECRDGLVKYGVVGSIVGLVAAVCDRLGTVNINGAGDLTVGVGLIGLSRGLGIVTAGCGMMALCKGVFYFRYDRSIRLTEKSRRSQ